MWEPCCESCFDWPLYVLIRKHYFLFSSLVPGIFLLLLSPVYYHLRVLFESRRWDLLFSYHYFLVYHYSKNCKLSSTAWGQLNDCHPRLTRTAFFFESLTRRFGFLCHALPSKQFSQRSLLEFSTTHSGWVFLIWYTTSVCWFLLRKFTGRNFSSMKYLFPFLFMFNCSVWSAA